jgi:hypothetical protein
MAKRSLNSNGVVHVGSDRVRLLLLAVFAMSAAWAGTTGRVTGIVTDAAGVPIAGATVIATSASTGVKSTAQTDKKGSYSFITLVPGVYTLEAERTGFKSSARKALTVHVDSAIKMDLMLEGEAGTERGK